MAKGIKVQPKALEKFINHFITKYYKTAWLIGFKILNNPDLADEATQVLFESMLKPKKLNMLCQLPENELKAYLSVSAKYSAFGYYKRENKHAHIDMEEVEFLLSDAEALAVDEMMIKEEDSIEIRKCMDEIPAQYKDIILMRFTLEMSYQEIGNLLHIKEGNARIRLHRALRHLKEALESQERRGEREEA